MNYSECGFPIIDDEVDYDVLFDRKSKPEESKPNKKENKGEILSTPLFDIDL